MHKLERMNIKTITKCWRPGTDRLTWAEEHDYLTNLDKERTDKLRAAVREYGGYHFADETSPVKLGNDGRVWNGHHRIILALEDELLRHTISLGLYDSGLRGRWPEDLRGISLNVLIVGPDERE